MKSVHAISGAVDAHPGLLAIVREGQVGYRITVRSHRSIGSSMGSVVYGRQQLRQLVSDLLMELQLAEQPVPPKLVPEDVRHAGQMMSNVCFNWKQHVGHTITAFDATMLATLQGNWDAAVAGTLGAVAYWKDQAENCRVERDELRWAAHTSGAASHG